MTNPLTTSPFGPTEPVNLPDDINTVHLRHPNGYTEIISREEYLETMAETKWLRDWWQEQTERIERGLLP